MKTILQENIIYFICRLRINGYFCMNMVGMHMNNLCNRVLHKGFIESIEGNHAVVRVSRTSACSSCSSSLSCSKFESKEIVIDIHDSSVYGYKKGDNVIVAMYSALAYKALLYAFAIPLFILLLFFILSHVITDNELFVSFISFCSIVPYYLFLYIKRSKFNNGFSFEIIDINKV